MIINKYVEYRLKKDYAKSYNLEIDIFPRFMSELQTLQEIGITRDALETYKLTYSEFACELLYEVPKFVRLEKTLSSIPPNTPEFIAQQDKIATELQSLISQLDLLIKSPQEYLIDKPHLVARMKWQTTFSTYKHKIDDFNLDSVPDTSSLHDTYQKLITEYHKKNKWYLNEDERFAFAHFFYLLCTEEESLFKDLDETLSIQRKLEMNSPEFKKNYEYLRDQVGFLNSKLETLLESPEVYINRFTNTKVTII